MRRFGTEFVQSSAGDQQKEVFVEQIVVIVKQVQRFSLDTETCQRKFIEQVESFSEDVVFEHKKSVLEELVDNQKETVFDVARFVFRKT